MRQTVRPYLPGLSDDRICIVINDGRDELVTIPVASLINTDIDKMIKAFGTFRLDLVQRPVNTAADSLPIDPHVFGDGTSWQIDGKSPDSQFEVFA